jgi:NTE family protein
MTSPRNGAPTRAVVLGGGGAVGVGWQTGLLTGLREAGVNLAGAEAILGTSAGALVGALLASGRDVADALGSLAALGRNIDHDSLTAGHDAFLSAMRSLSELRAAPSFERAAGEGAVRGGLGECREGGDDAQAE